MIYNLLPLVSFAALCLLIANLRPRWGWRRVFLRSTLVVGVYAIVILELLSIFQRVGRATLIAAWLLPIAVSFGWIRRIVPSQHDLRFPRIHFPVSWFERLALILILAIVILTGVIAWFAPPTTYDSLTYHMSRVAHWAQEGGVVPYASGILRQNYMSPGAEMDILHVYVLGQSDRFANLIQWSAMVMSLIGVSLLAADLGASRQAQIFASLFAATLPMGIAQASSTMTDYVTGMWVLLAASEVLRFQKGDRAEQTLPFAACAAGLAFLAKPTGAVFVIPFGIFAFVFLVKRYPLRQIIRYVLMALTIVVLINLGYLTRNWLVFGNPLGGGNQVQMFTNEAFNLRVLVSNLLRNASLHAGTPWPEWNQALYSLLAKVHWKLGLDLTDSRTSMHPFFKIWEYPSNETRATNTIQAVLLLLAGLIITFRWRKYQPQTGWFGIMLAGGFLLFVALFKFDLLGSRYHMPFFVLAAPFVAAVMGKALKPWALALLTIALVVGALPILFRLDSRPLLPSETKASVITARRLDQYFNDAPYFDEAYIPITDRIEAAGCSEIGVMLGGDSPEYPLWVLLDAPASDVVIGWIISRQDVSGSYRPDDFTPCAVICEKCDWAGESFNGLPLDFEAGPLRLYLGN
ncbi:MAG: glycosyltransferase family 39 protein [Anaerolineales bacterium]|jgi:4-amino-4-deoxy-L-arabinose transferase-like glycosyltransferase